MIDGKSFQPAQKRCGLPAHQDPFRILFNLMGCSLIILPRQEVLDSRVEHFVFSIPLACPDIQIEDRFFIRLLQTFTQHFCKQSVVAIPLPLIIERNQEKIGIDQLVQDLRCLRFSGNCLAKRN